MGSIDKNHTRRVIVAVTAGVLSLALAPFHASAADGNEVPVALSTALLLKIVGYDQNLVIRSPEEVHITVLYFDDSKARAKIIERLIARVAASRRIAGRRITHTAIRFDGAALSVHLDATRARVLIVVGSDSVTRDDVRTIGALARARHVLTLSRSVKWVEIGELSVAIELARRKPRIVVNLEGVSAEGAHFSPKFLRLCRVIRSDK